MPRNPRADQIGTGGRIKSESPGGCARNAQALEKTWAHEAGHVKVKTFEDLLDVTFFGSDAAIYSLDNGKITAKEGYFDNLRRKTLEINLLPNPNPIGNTVRALRYVVIKDFGWGPKLSEFVAEQIGIHGWQVIIDREIASFGNRYIGEMDHERIEKELSRYISCNRGGVLRIGEFGRLRQYQFEFESLTSPQVGAGKRGRVWLCCSGCRFDADQHRRSQNVLNS